MKLRSICTNVNINIDQLRELKIVEINEPNTAECILLLIERTYRSSFNQEIKKLINNQENCTFAYLAF